MLISYSRQDPITWSLLGTGAAFLTSSARLTNGRPTSATRIQWLSGTQTTSSVLTLRGTHSGNTQNIRLCGLIGTTLPVGTKVVCKRKFDLSWVGPQEQRVVERSDGVRVVWFYFDEDGSSREGFEFEIYNDVNGFAEIVADSDFEIGEAWGGLASEWCIRPTYQSDRNDFSKQKLSINGQPFPTRRRASAISQLEFTPVLYSKALADGNSLNGESFKSIRARLLGYKPCVIVPMTAEPFTGGAIDQDFINANAEFGYAKTLGPIVGEAPRFVFSATFEAPPVLLP